MTEAILIILGGIMLFCIIFLKAVKFEYGIFPCENRKKETPAYIILNVKNNEECIEGVIYTLIKNMHTQTDTAHSSNILVIDHGSQDNTLEILARLSKKYEFIHLLQSSLYIDMVNH